MSEWQPIDTAPRVEFAYLLGFDAQTAEDHGDYKAGLCIIRWFEPDDDMIEEGYEAGWEVQPFSEGLDVIVSETNVTHWRYLPDPPEKQA